jgi:uncharacterized protein
MEDAAFEWDDDKAALNLGRHGVSFDDARKVFSDPFGASREDRREDYGEERFVVIGMAGDRLLHVSYTHRGERIRIISARFPEPRERRRYHDENHD